MRTVSAAKGLTLVVQRAADSAGLRTAFASLEKQRPGGLVFAGTGLLTAIDREITDAARRLRFASISGYGRYSTNGGLLSYGPDYVATYRYAAKFVDLILKGAKPADLPVEQVSQFELRVNQKTAREIGVKVPQSVLLRADQVIE